MHILVFMWSIQEGPSPRLRGRSVQEPSCQFNSTSLCILSLHVIDKSATFPKVLI